VTTAALARTAFTTDRTLEFFSESELTTQMGYGRNLWPLVLVKELIDNALDACETTNKAPEITVTLEPDAITVTDNGPGIPPETVERSLDYHVRISDKKYYLSPTRGQLGNALKCVWAAPFVADGQHGIVEVEACGRHHLIQVSLDRIAQLPHIRHTIESSVKNGTSVKIHWDGVAKATNPPVLNFFTNQKHPQSQATRPPIMSKIPTMTIMTRIPMTMTTSKTTPVISCPISRNSCRIMPPSTPT
jgi:DNA topoisomerase VI subunit B